MSSVGVRALQQNASAVVGRAAAGETIEITDRGRPVARLVPLRPSDRLTQLATEGRLRPATRDVLDIPPPSPTRGQRLSEVLAAARDSER